MNYKETLDYIHSLGNFSLPAGLERIKKVLNKLGNPQDKFRSIHIAGTNGKGSVSAMLSSVFAKAGYRTGLFISPFIIDFRERIQINGEYIHEKDLTEYAEKIINTQIKLTEFEFITAVAFLYFAEQNVDIVICETGLGGRLDATNILENKVVSVITKIGLDHTAILGDTIEEISAEKCGILRDCPTVVNPYQEKSALKVIESSAKQLIVPDISQLKILSCEDFGNTYIYKEKEYKLTLCGEFQIENAITAIEAIWASGYNIPYNIIYEGLKEAYIPTRMEIVSKKPLTVLDGAHNPDGGAVLSKELCKYSGNVTAIIGMMKDKDYEDFLKITLKHCKTAIAVEVRDMPRSLKAEELKETAMKYCECVTAKNYKEAVLLARKTAGNNPVFIFGSLYLVSGMRKILNLKE